MRILLFIPQHTFSIDANRELVSMLNERFNSFGEKDDIHAVVSHTYSPQILQDINIVHIFGCWNHTAAKVMQKATKAGIPTVFSPLGGLEPWTMKGKTTTRDIQKNLYQRRMVKQASAIHIGGKFENEMFSRLRWNNKVAIIKNPALTSLVTPDDMVRQMLVLYRKVFDSNVYSLMSRNAINALSFILYAAICKDLSKMPQAQNAAIAEVEKIDDEDWRNICIYATDEHIVDYIAQGISKLSNKYSMIDVDSSNRFMPKQDYQDGDLRADDILSSNIMLKSKVEDIASDDQQTERGLCIMILNAKYEIAHNSLPLRHIVNLAERLINDDYDEDVLATMLDETNATTFMARLETVMTHIIHLSEGYMPIKPIDNKSAKELTEIITKLKYIL